jgi:hypothetical protein
MSSELKTFQRGITAKPGNIYEILYRKILHSSMERSAFNGTILISLDEIIHINTLRSTLISSTT